MAWSRPKFDHLTAHLNIWNYIRGNPDWKSRLEETGNFSPDNIRAHEVFTTLQTEEDVRELFGRAALQKSRREPHWWRNTTYNNPSQPVVGVTWFEARAYCAWLAAVTERTYWLPTEAEWEAAARGPEGRRYPWEGEWDSARANTIEGRVLKPSPVGVYAAAGGVGPFKAEDQSGNVWEWTSSLYIPYAHEARDRENPEAEGERCVRGGSSNLNHRGARCAYRLRFVPDGFYDFVGFRVLSPVSISGS